MSRISLEGLPEGKEGPRLWGFRMRGLVSGWDPQREGGLFKQWLDL